MNLDVPSGWLGLALLVVGVFVLIKAAKSVIKLAMLALIAGGAYLLFFADKTA